MTKITTKFLKEKITQDWLKNPIFQEIVDQADNEPDLFLEKNWKRTGKIKGIENFANTGIGPMKYWGLQANNGFLHFHEDDFEVSEGKLFINLTEETVKNKVVVREFQNDDFCIMLHVITNEEDTEVLAVFHNMD